MRKISPKVKAKILADRFYEKCARHCPECKGRITWEHCLIFGGKQIDEAWAIIPLCAYHHEVDQYQDCGDLDKEINVWIALNRATDEELKAYSKAVDYINKKQELNKKYGGVYNSDKRRVD